MPEPSCATRKLATLTFVLRGHLPNITLCTTRNSYSCYTVKVPRRRPDPLRLFSHLSRNSAPGVCGKPQLKRRRTAMPTRNGRLSAPPLAGAREEANDQACRRSPRQAGRWGTFRHHQAGRAASPVQHAFRNYFRFTGQPESDQGIGCRLDSACRPQPTAASGLNPSRPLAPTVSRHPTASGMADAKAVDRQRPRWVKIAPPCRPRTQTRSLRQDHIRYSTLRSSCASRLLTNRGLTVSGKRMSGCTV